MSSFETVLFIGGPHDGKRMSVIAGVPTVIMHELQRSPLSPADLPENMAAPKRHIYRLTPHRGPERTYPLYVHEDVEDAMDMLIAGYRP